MSGEITPGVNEPPRRPPHPLDARWSVYAASELYGPYTGHELKAMIADGVVAPESQVVRVGFEDWHPAIEDKILAPLFRPLAPPAPILSASNGAAVVNVTNQIEAPRVLLESGPAADKSPGTAFLLSFIFCGLGQLYNGQVLKGILMFFGCVLLWFVLLGWIINIWSWIDAYQTAKAMRARYLARLVAGVPQIG